MDIVDRERLKGEMDALLNCLCSVKAEDSSYKVYADSLSRLYDLYSKQDKDDQDYYIHQEELRLKSEAFEYEKEQKYLQLENAKKERRNSIVKTILTGAFGVIGIYMVTSFENEGIVKSKAFSIASKMLPVLKG